MPTPKTLKEFDSREFAAEHQVFSSFAYLIGVFQALSYALEGAAEGSRSAAGTHPFESLAVANQSWLLLLPESKTATYLCNGEVDELMFQAHMTVEA